MKSIIIAAVFCFTGVSAYAAGESYGRTYETNKSKTKTSFSRVSQSLQGFSIVGLFSAANRLPLDFGDATVDAKSENAFGIGFEYRMDLTHYTPSKSPVSVTGGLVYESSRELKARTFQGNQDFFPGSNPSFTMVIPYVNMGYILTDNVSLVGGINFPVPRESDFDEVSLSGQLGFQGGVSMLVSKNFGADFTYRWVNIKGNNGLNRIDVDGLVVKGRYIF